MTYPVPAAASEDGSARVVYAIKRRLSADPRIERVAEIATLHLGPRSILVALTLSLTSDMTLKDLRQAIRDLTIALQQVAPRIA